MYGEVMDVSHSREFLYLAAGDGGIFSLSLTTEVRLAIIGSCLQLGIDHRDRPTSSPLPPRPRRRRRHLHKHGERARRLTLESVGECRRSAVHLSRRLVENSNVPREMKTKRERSRERERRWRGGSGRQSSGEGCVLEARVQL